MPHKPQKKWGQNFLRNREAARRIVDAVQPEDGDVIVEIGPGEGALTALLVELGHPVEAIEIDPALASRLGERVGSPLLTVHHEDATDAALPDRPFRAVGNLPYNVATPILRRVISQPSCRRAVFMVQKEVADRITARAGEEPYGYLSLFVEAWADARVILALAPGSFWPPPKVRSAVVQLDPVDRPFASSREAVLELVSASFRMRRKKLVNNLVNYHGLGKGDLEAILTENGLGPGVRAEAMSLKEFDLLAAAIESRAGGSGPAGSGARL